MRVAKIGIKNVLGIEELEIEPGALTVIRGGNGRGKTSTVEAIKSVLEGGHDATLIRTGAEAAEVVLVLDDGVEIRKRITEKGSTVSVTHPELGGLRGPQGYVSKLTDALSTNPVAFLTAPAKKRGEYLLEAAPLTVTVDDLTAAIGDAALFGPIMPSWAEGHALEVIARVHKFVYDERTGVNRAAKEKRSTVEQLSASLPEAGEADEDPAEELARIEKEREAVTAEYQRASGEIRAAAAAEAEKLEEQCRKQVGKIDEQIRTLERRSRELVEGKRGAVDQVNRSAEEKVHELHAAAKEQVAELRMQGEVLATRAREAGRHANTRRIVDGLAREAEAAEGRAEALTGALTSLEALKASLLEQLPIAGVEVREGEIYRDGIPFDRLNRAQQVQLAIDVARLRAGKLGLICVDGLECLDELTFHAFCERAAQEDLQLIVTRVTEGAFAVESLHPAGAS